MRIDNAERFLDAFAKIERQLKLISDVSKYARFYQLLQQAAAKSGLVRKFELELQEFADLRNVIVHQRSEEGRIIAIPVDEVVDTIENIAHQLCEPSLVSQKFLKTVQVCSPQMDIMEVYLSMEKLQTTKMPVYNQGNFTSLLTTEMITRWVFRQLRQKLPLVGKVSDALYFVDKKERVAFVKRDATVADIQDLFEENLHQGGGLSVILITEAGLKSQKPIGIITAADLPLLYELTRT